MVGRTAESGDELGSRLLSARLAGDLMLLAFALSGWWAPYPKWRGTVFRSLPVAAEVGPLLDAAVTAAGWRERENALAVACELLLDVQRERLQPTPEAAVIPFWDRPYRTVDEAVPRSLLAGVTDMALTTLAPLDPYFRAGKLRALATTGKTRTPLLPETPTLAEQGIKGYPTYSWWGVYAPAGTPRPIVERMNEEIAKAVRSPEVAPKLEQQIGMEILATSPEAFADFQKVEQERWARIITENGIKAD